jgi:hypothetical protein
LDRFQRAKIQQYRSNAMNVDLDEKNMKLIKVALNKFYTELCEEKKKLKAMFLAKSKGKKNLFFDIINPSGRIKEINQKLEEILSLENLIFVKRNNQ